MCHGDCKIQIINQTFKYMGNGVELVLKYTGINTFS